MKVNYNISVFINCPFDQEYSPIFQSIIFTVIDCGYIARCASEISDSSEVRIDKIIKSYQSVSMVFMIYHVPTWIKDQSSSI